MNTGKINIRVKEKTQELSVYIELSPDGTVWLTRHEIADLFGVYIQTVTAGLKTIQRNGLFRDNTVKYYCYLNTQGIQCTVELYNLETIIPLSYYMQGGICSLFRDWLCNQAKNQRLSTTVPRPPILIQFNRTELL